MADVKKLNLAGTEYDIKDATARQDIDTHKTDADAHESLFAEKIDITSIVNDDTTGGAAVPASAEIVKTHGAEIDANAAKVANMSDAFNVSTAYAAGDYAIHNNVLYRFTAAHSAGAWVGTDATIVKVTDEIKTNSTQISELTHYTVAADVSNVFTLDLSNGLNFMLTVGNTTAKTIQISNVPVYTNILLPVTVLVVYSYAAAITHPTGIVWQGGVVPTFTAGNKYVLMYSSWNNGTSWRGSVSGAWAV